MNSIEHTIERVTHDLILARLQVKMDGKKWGKDIPQLEQRLVELRAELATIRAAEDATLNAFSHRQEPSEQARPILSPLGMDESPGIGQDHGYAVDGEGKRTRKLWE